jgi:16S rRNA processing protein RimM
MYLIGKVTTTHGIRGEIKVLNMSDYSRFNTGDEVLINDVAYTITGSRPHKGQLIVKLKGVETMNDALHLKDFEIFSNVRIRDDGYHYEDIVGLEVWILNGEKIGHVIAIREVPQGSILEVQLSKKVVLIPFVDAFVKLIEHNKIYIEPIEGLL